MRVCNLPWWEIKQIPLSVWIPLLLNILEAFNCVHQPKTPLSFWGFHPSSEKYSCSNPLINVCLGDVSMETVFTAPRCAKNGSKVITAPDDWKAVQRYDGQWQWLTQVKFLNVETVARALLDANPQLFLTQLHETLKTKCPFLPSWLCKSEKRVNYKTLFPASPSVLFFPSLSISLAGCYAEVLNMSADEHNLDRDKLEIEVDLVAICAQRRVQIVELKRLTNVIIPSFVPYD